MLVRYLFDAGLPLLNLRHAVRSNNVAIINMMWIYMLNFFRATNKNHYAKMCVHVTFTYYKLKDVLRDAFDRRRTASLRGHNGRNVALDFLLERMNLEVATLLGNDVKPERIPEVIRQLNGIRHIRTRALEAFGISSHEIREDHPVTEGDVLALVDHIKRALGFDGNDDATKLFTPRSNNPFRTGTETGDGRSPWTKVRAVEASESTEAYVRRMTRMIPGNDLPTM